jgi:arylsulfatase A-like enzyme
MTGRHPFRGNVPNHGHYLRPHEITIAEALKAADYVTGHFGKWHIGSVQPGSPTSPGGQGFDEWLSGLNFFDNDPYLSRNGTYERHEGSGSMISMDATIEFLEKHKDDGKPMFTVTWLPAPHDPFGEVPEGIPNANKLHEELGKSAGYYREITLLDQQVGRLRKSLRDLGISKNTLFLYHSDNGGLVAESSGGRMKKGSIYEGGLRAPAILEWPSRYLPAEIDTPINSSDLYPTLLEIAGVNNVEHQPKLDGISIVPILDKKTSTHPPMGFWHGYMDGQATWSDRIIKSLMAAQQSGAATPYPDRILKNVNAFPQRDKTDLHGHAAWTNWPWKLHRIQIKTGADITWELYKLDDDPIESKDVLDQHPDRVAKMRVELEDWQRSVLDSWSGNDYPKN